MRAFGRPAPDEHDPYYAGYVAQVPDGDVLDILAEQSRTTPALLEPLPPSTWRFRYAPGKWSLGEVVGHLCDAERIMAYRALRFARADRTDLPGFEENAYTPAGRFDERSPESLLDEYRAVRAASLALFRNLPPGVGERRGIANGHPMSVRALVYVIAGHERHHLQVLRERYLRPPQ